MRYLLGFICVMALGVMGCGETTGMGGSGGDGGDGRVGGDGGDGGVGGDGGDGGVGGSIGEAFPCTEQGIRDAIALGGGPHTFDCNGPTTIATSATTWVNNDVILDGRGDLTLTVAEDGGGRGDIVVWVGEGVTAELRGFTITGGEPWTSCTILAGGIYNAGALKLIDCTISGNAGIAGGGIYNTGTLLLQNSTVSENIAEDIWGCGAVGGYVSGGGIFNVGTATLIDSVVSENVAEETWDCPACGRGCTEPRPCSLVPGFGGGIFSGGTLLVTNSTVSQNVAEAGGGIHAVGPTTIVNATIAGNVAVAGSAILIQPSAEVTLAASVVEGVCRTVGGIGVVLSSGYNIESPGNTCGFDQDTDQFNVSAEALALAPLADYGGRTATHALGVASVALDVIPEAECLDADGQPLTTDQRGFPRRWMCDAGAFEVQLDFPCAPDGCR
jgi:hypothetical protein